MRWKSQVQLNSFGPMLIAWPNLCGILNTTITTFTWNLYIISRAETRNVHQIECGSEFTIGIAERTRGMRLWGEEWEKWKVRREEELGMVCNK